MDKLLILNGPNRFQMETKPVSNPMIKNVKIVTNEKVEEFIKNKLFIRWVNGNPERFLCLMARKEGEDMVTRIQITSFTKNLIELNGNILKLNSSKKIIDDDLGIDPNQEVIITLTEAGLKKFNTMLKKWILV